jgi:hypothetical protein
MERRFKRALQQISGAKLNQNHRTIATEPTESTESTEILYEYSVFFRVLPWLFITVGA